MNPTIKVLLRTDFTKKDGSRSIYLRLTINRKVKYYSLSLSCLEKHWNQDRCRLGRSAPDFHRINTLVDMYENRGKQIIFDYQVNRRHLSFEEFLKDFRNEHYGSQSFIVFVMDQANRLKGKLSPGTIKNYHDQLNKLKDFRNEITFSEIDNNFMLSYETFLIKQRKNNRNTVIKSLSFIKAMVNKAIEQGYITENLCKNYKLGRIEGNREYLTLKELERLDSLYHNETLKPNKANVLRYFLFCCYTGLRLEKPVKLTT